jgi:hypothetical protein
MRPRNRNEVWMFTVIGFFLIGFAGPSLISSANSLEVVTGVALLGVWLCWGSSLIRRV